MAFAALGERDQAWALLTMLNPINHARSAADVATYTGAAGWMYRLITESLLGLRLHGEKLSLAPCRPARRRR